MEALRHHPQPFHCAHVLGFVWSCDVLCLYLRKNQTHQPHQPRFAGYESQVRLQYVSKVPGSEKSIKALCSPHGWKPSDRIEVPQKSSCCNGGGGRRGRGKMENVTPLLPFCHGSLSLAGFLKWGCPKIIHFNRIYMDLPF